MEPSSDFDRTADLCIEACEAAMEHGTPEMKLAARILLEALGRELARREQAERPAYSA